MDLAIAGFLGGSACLIFSLILFYVARPLDDLSMSIEKKSSGPMTFILRVFREGSLRESPPWVNTRVASARFGIVLAILMYLLGVWGIVSYLLGIK